MNIAIFTPNQNPYSETFIQAHKNYLKGQVFYYYGRNNIRLEGQPKLIEDNKRKLLKLQQKLFKKPSIFIQEKIISQSLQKNKIDIVLVEYGSHATHLLPIIKKSGLPMVVHFHGYDASVKKVIQENDNYKNVFSYASKVIAVSRKMETMLLEIGCPREKLVYNVYGPRPEFLKIMPKFSKKQYVAVGRFTDKKAPYYTLLAFKKAVEKHPEAKLIMAGDGQLVNTCKNLAMYFNIQETVTFPGVITSEEYQELLSESLGFVQHSITAASGDMEGTPLAILEASAAGVPVIATYHAGIPDVIINNKTGLLCNEHDVEKMADNMIALLESPEEAKMLGNTGKKYIKEHFSMERHIDTLQELLKDAQR